jgi:hypothetical protein
VAPVALPSSDEGDAVNAATPIAARRIGDRLRRAGHERAQLRWPSAQFRNQPERIARDVLGIRSLARHQREILRAYYADDRASIIVCTGQKLGKTEIEVIVAATDFATEPGLQGFVFGPKIDHTNAIFWPRFAKAIIEAYHPCPACWEEHEDWCSLVELHPFDETPRPERCPNCSPLIPSELRDPKKPEKGRVSDWLNQEDAEGGLRAPDGRVVRGYAGRSLGSKGGISGTVRFYADECSDIDDETRESWQGNMSGGGKFIGFGNLLYPYGWFARAFQPERNRYTLAIQMSSRLSPNCQGRIVWSDGKVTENKAADKPIKGMADVRGIEANLAAWRGSPNLIASRIDAEKVTIIDGQLASLGIVVEAERRWNDTSIAGEGPLHLGVDVGRTRDPLVIAPRRGRRIFELRSDVPGDHATGASLVASCAREYRKTHEAKPRVTYDASGKEGRDFHDEIKRYAHEMELYPIVATFPPRQRKRFDKLRDEIAHYFAEWLKQGAIPPMIELEGEIEATTAKSVKIAFGGVQWEVMRVISNDELRALIGRSPNHRNACELAVWPVRAEDENAELPDAELLPAKRKAKRADEEAPRQDYYGDADAGMRAVWGEQ